jgi:hypothetical protein
MNEIVRLRKEKQEYEQSSFDEGRALFDTHLDQTSYKEIMKFVAVERERKMGRTYDLYSTLLEITGTKPIDWEDPLEDQDVESFCRGYFARALETYETELRDRL